MLRELLPFQLSINTTAIAGACLWSLALYLGFSNTREWITVQLERWFNFAERSLYTSAKEFEKTRVARESQNAFYASLFSIIPFIAVGIICNYGVEWSLGSGWAVSVGILACVACGVYELGRRDGQSG